MNKNNIIHFVGFITKLEQQIFVDQWMQYAREFLSTPGSVILQEKTRNAGKYNYISQHAFNEEDFSFSFMKGRNTENFAEQKARVVMLGGYTPVEMGNRQVKEKDDIRMIVFFGQDNRVDVDMYRNLIQSSCLNVYQPFYENCMYGLILEFLTNKVDAVVLLDELLNRKENVEVSIYRTCRIPQAVS